MAVAVAWRANRRGGWQRAAIVAIALAVGIGVAVLAWIYSFQESLIFHPERLPAEHRFALQRCQRSQHRRRRRDPVGLHLKLPAPRGVVFFLHGNNGNLATWFTNSDFYRAANYDLFMLDYRGYGKSSGRIDSEAQLRADVLAAWQVVERSTSASAGSSMAALWARHWRRASRHRCSPT
jgi:hypothetical protein